MTVIKSHNITLYGGNDEFKIILRPLADEHLPYLYKWSSDPDITYWTEGEHDNSAILYDKKTVHAIYGGVSQNALCFLVEVNGSPIGECWLQKMNLPDVLAIYPQNTDVRRIDMVIGEKSYWGKGVGSLFVGMLIDFAFNGENIDLLHCFCEDYNVRSQKIWQRKGFELIRKDKLADGLKGKWQYHYLMTKEQYINRKRVSIDNLKVFFVPILDLQPTQLYISMGKLNLLNSWFKDSDASCFDPIPIKKIMNRLAITDGHTRILAVYKSGYTEIPCYYDTDDLDWEAYKKDIIWCTEEGIKGIDDLAKRIVPHKDFEVLWRKKCMDER